MENEVDDKFVLKCLSFEVIHSYKWYHFTMANEATKINKKQKKQTNKNNGT